MNKICQKSCIRPSKSEKPQIELKPNDIIYEMPTESKKKEEKNISCQLSKFPELNDPNWIKQKYCVEKLSLNQIRKLIGADSLITVKRAFVRFNIPRRKWRGGYGLVAFGEEKSMKDWSNDVRCVVSYYTLAKRLENGWDIERAITEVSCTSKDYLTGQKFGRLLVKGFSGETANKGEKLWICVCKCSKEKKS